jgi:hypothetical protein
MIDLTGYKLTFDDEFNNLNVSQSGQNTVWADIRPDWRLNSDADIGFGDSGFVDAASGIDPFSIENGALNINAVQTSNPALSLGNWASGLIESQNSFSQEYGYFEIRAQLPTDTGVWPAFSMMPENDSWPPELDVFEAYGTSDLYQTVHTGVTGADTTQTTWSDQPGMLSGFHTYGVLWTPDQITFYFDGTEVGQQPTPADLDQPMFLQIDLAMQVLAGVSSDPKSMQVDYVRAYSDDPNAAAVPLGPVSSPDGLDSADLHGAAPAPPPPADYGGNGTSGILLANPQTGALVLAQVTGGSGESYQQIGGLGPEWVIAGYGNFLGDSTDGFLMFDTKNGGIVVGEDNSGTAKYTQVSSVGSEWSVVGTGKFAGQATSDFLLLNTNGTLAVGAVSGTTTTYTAIGGIGSAWSIKGTGELLGDGRAGFLMENTNGSLAVGEDVGGTASYTAIGGVGPEWNILGIGDLLDDGQDDFLMRSTNNGALVVGEVQGGTAQYTQIGNIGPEWQFLGIGDYDGANNAEIALLNTNSGALVVGTVLSGATTYQQIGAVGLSDWSFHVPVG